MCISPVCVPSNRCVVDIERAMLVIFDLRVSHRSALFGVC